MKYNQRNYKFTTKGEWFQVEVWDSYGNKRSVYEKDLLDACDIVQDYWNTEEERQESNKLMSRAIVSMNKIDKESGILTGNSDGLD